MSTLSRVSSNVKTDRGLQRADSGRQETNLARLDDPVGRFLADARRYRRLSEDEERSLGRAVRDRHDREAARRLVLHNLCLVVSIAYEYRQRWLALLDLLQEGCIGLMEAVERWDPDVGTRLGSYAAYWIRAYILRFLMTNCRLVHLGNTRAGRKLFFRLEKERQKLLAAGFEPTPRLLAAKLDVDEAEVAAVATHMSSREVPFEASPGPDGVPSLSERLPSPAPTPEETVGDGEIVEAVRRVIRKFEASLADERERAIWREHLATSDEPLPLVELGARFGVTKQRAGQIADRLKKRFRTEIARELGPDVRAGWSEQRL